MKGYLLIIKATLKKGEPHKYEYIQEIYNKYEKAYKKLLDTLEASKYRKTYSFYANIKEIDIRKETIEMKYTYFESVNIIQEDKNRVMKKTINDNGIKTKTETILKKENQEDERREQVF